MALSNTATPKYYAMYREAIDKGYIPICREIEMEMGRIEELIADPSIYYDPTIVEGFIAFCNRECTLTNGEPLRLLPIFKVWAEQVLGWYYYADRPDGKGGRKQALLRLTHKQYLIVGRGAAKTMYAALLQAYFLVIDKDTTHQIAVAFTMKQADETLSPIRTAITRARGPLFKFLTSGSIHNTTGPRALRQQLVSTKKGIENFLTNSLVEIRPMSVDKLQSLRTKIATVDEWLSSEVREDVVGAIEQGSSKIDDYLIIAISSEGTIRNGVGDTIKMELASILSGDYINPHVSIFHYKLDHSDEVADPALWMKAQPNLGETVSYDTYALEVERSIKAPGIFNDTMAKRFGLPMEGTTFYFAYEDTVLHPRRPKAFDGMTCALGADLSRGDDFCAFTFLFPLRDGSFGIRTRSYITRTTFDKLPGALNYKYRQFIEDGTLIILEGVVLDMTEVYLDLIAHIRRRGYRIVTLGYDPYNATEFIKRWTEDNTSWGVEKIIQGARTESVPLGEIKALAEERLLYFDEEIMKYTMGNAVVWYDLNGNGKLTKRRGDEKIDNVSALLDAYVAYKRHQEEF